jgi:hypothetical protein
MFFSWFLVGVTPYWRAQLYGVFFLITVAYSHWPAKRPPKCDRGSNPGHITPLSKRGATVFQKHIIITLFIFILFYLLAYNVDYVVSDVLN